MRLLVGQTMRALYIAVCVLVLCGTSAEKEVPEDFAFLLSDELQQQIEKRLSDYQQAAPSQPAQYGDTTQSQNRLALVSDPGSGCYYNVEESTIIRTHDSINNGASYIDSPVDIQNRSQCRAECCKHAECDLAVFKDKGDEHACYLFACGDSCFFTNHSGFSTMRKYRKPQQHEQDLENLATEPPTTTPAPTTTTTPQPTTTTTTPSPTQKQGPAALFGSCLSDTDCTGPHTECVSGVCGCNTGYHAQEGICREECSRFQFECVNAGKPLAYPQCIAVYDTCDGISHCQDGSDELKCDAKQVLAGGGGAIDTSSLVDKQQQQAWLLQQQQLQQQQQQQLLNSGYIPSLLGQQQIYPNSQQQNPYGYSQQLPQLQQQALQQLQQGQQQQQINSVPNLPVQQVVAPVQQQLGAQAAQQVPISGQQDLTGHIVQQVQQQPIPQQPIQQQPVQQQPIQQQQPQQIQTQQIQQQPQQIPQQQQVVPQQVQQQQVPHHVAKSGQKLGQMATANRVPNGGQVQQSAVGNGGQAQAAPVQVLPPQQQQPVQQQQQIQQQPLHQQLANAQQGSLNNQQVASPNQQIVPQKQGGGREVDYPSGRGRSQVDAVSQQRPQQPQQQPGQQQQPPGAVHADHMSRPIPPKDDFHPVPPPTARPVAAPADGSAAGSAAGRPYVNLDRNTGRLLSPPQTQGQGDGQAQHAQRNRKPAGHINYSDGGFIVSDDTMQTTDDNNGRRAGMADKDTSGLSAVGGGGGGGVRQRPYDLGQTLGVGQQGRSGLGDLGRTSWQGQTADSYLKPGGVQGLGGGGGGGVDSYRGSDPRGRSNLGGYGGYDTNSYPQSYPGYDQLYAYADPDAAPANPRTDYDYQYAAESPDENLNELVKLLEDVLQDNEDDDVFVDAQDELYDDYGQRGTQRRPYFDPGFMDQQKDRQQDYDYYDDTGSVARAETGASDVTGSEGDGSFWDFYDSSSNYRPWTGSNSKSSGLPGTDTGIGRGRGSSLGLQGGGLQNGGNLQPNGGLQQGGGVQRGRVLQPGGGQQSLRGPQNRIPPNSMQDARTNMGINAQIRPVQRPDSGRNPDMTSGMSPQNGVQQRPHVRPSGAGMGANNNNNLPPRRPPLQPQQSQQPTRHTETPPVQRQHTADVQPQQPTHQPPAEVPAATDIPAPVSKSTDTVASSSPAPSEESKRISKPAHSGAVVAGHVAANPLLNEAEAERPSGMASNKMAVVVLALGLAVTALLLIFVGCRLRMVKRRLRRGRPLNSNEADYLINGMYL